MSVLSTMLANINKKWLAIGIFQLGGIIALIVLAIIMAITEWPYIIAFVVVLIEQVIADYFVIKNLKSKVPPAS
jgi:hypothetical protein